MKATLYSPIPYKEQEVPWFYILGGDILLDFTTYNSTEDWKRRRVAPLLRWQKLDVWLTTALLVALILCIVMLLLGAMGTGLGTFVTITTWVLPAGVVISTVMRRRSQVGLVRARVGTPLAQQLFKLGSFLNLLHTIHYEGLHEVHPEITQRVDPEAATEIVRTSLHMRADQIDAEYIESLLDDLHEGLHTTTGLSVHRSHD